MTADNSVTPGTVLVTGAAGMLARALVPKFISSGYRLVTTDIDLSTRTPWGLSGPVLSHLDVREHATVLAAIRRIRPDFVLHLAAETKLETCEQSPEHAEATNATATREIARFCAGEGVKLVYISTAGVFDGRQDEPYTEDSAPNPINEYGRTKAVGEQYVADTIDDYLIVRAGWMVGGPREKDHKFVGRIVDQIREGRTVIEAVGDKFGSPTYAPDFGRTLAELIRTGAPSGLYHSVSECRRSRYDIAVEVVNALGRNDIEVREVGSEAFMAEFYAPRPRSEVLRNKALRAIGRNLMRPWPEPLAEYLAPWRSELGSLVRSSY